MTNSRRAVTWTLAACVPLAVGLAVSALLLFDYLRPSPVFCDPGGGCDQVKRSTYAALLGLPTPIFGVLGFLTLAALTLWRGPRARQAHVLVASVMAVFGVFFVSVQAQLGAFCKYCLVADAAALVAAVVAVVRVQRGWDAPEGKGRFAAAGALLGLAGATPVLVGLVLKPHVPRAIAEELARTPPGKVTVIDYVDFECPFCRMTHQELGPVLERHASQVRLVRKQVPLTRIHPHAKDAARAACCGEAQGRGEAIANALFTTEDLSAAGCERLAQEQGLDLTAFRACLADPRTDARIEAESAEFRAAQGRGLPTIWIGEQKLEGAQEAADIEAALARALSKS